MSWARILADAIVVFHVAYVLFIVLGLLVILIGVARGWAWVRNPWFRLIHVAMIGIVVAESLWGIACPLTVWERDLRALGGQAAHEQDFIAYWTHRLIFYDLPPWVFTLAYCLFGAAVGLTLVLAPPRIRSARVGPMHTP